MHDELTCGRVLSPVQHENDVLRHLLDEYPALFTVDELVSELAPPGEEGRMQRGGVRTAIADLTARGLLHHLGFYVWPTRAAKAAQVLTSAG